jgi:16S rRNA (adenine1518-N6/adenine1519-N6)-dimethyltransferase
MSSLLDAAAVKRLLERHGLRADKGFGQHFLVDTSIVTRIIELCEPYAGILEVGPGPGPLTSPLSMRAEKVIAIELDKRMVDVLSESAPAAKVIQQDALKANLREYLESLPTPRVLVSNMPYNITGPLLGKFGQVADLYERAVLMVQKEVADRILAQVGDSERRGLSIWLQSEFEIERAIAVPPAAFMPPPKVQSTVLRLIPRPSGLPKEFFGFVHGCFGQPKKTLQNNLKALGFEAGLAEKARLKPEVRPHQIPVEGFLALWESREGYRRADE